MNTYKIQIRVRYGETDQMGVVYHGNYAQYLEVARVEWLRVLGVSYKKMEEEGVLLPVVNLNINYKKPAVYDELLTVKISLLKPPTVSLAFGHEIYNEKGLLIGTAEVTLVFVNKATNKPMKCPKYIHDKIVKG